MACYDNVNEILACGEGDAFWKGYTNGKFPQDSSKYNSHQTNVIGGIIIVKILELLLLLFFIEKIFNYCSIY